MKSTFSCPVCDKTFDTLSELMRHAKISHSEQDILKGTKSSDKNTRAAFA